MADKIIDGDSVDWTRKSTANKLKGTTKYQHLIDGNARELDIRDYGHKDPVNFLTTVRKVARDRGLKFRTSILGPHTVLFQVTGKR